MIYGIDFFGPSHAQYQYTCHPSDQGFARENNCLAMVESEPSKELLKL